MNPGHQLWHTACVSGWCRFSRGSHVPKREADPGETEQVDHVKQRLSGPSIRRDAPIALTGNSERFESPEFPDAHRRWRRGRRDDRVRGFARGENCQGSGNSGAAGCRPDTAALAGPERGAERERAGADDRGRVLQGGPGPFQLAHDWPDAHHLRFLPASHQTAGRQARQGDEASGEPVRKPQRDRQGTRHGTSRARGAGRERAGNGRPEISRQPARQARPGVPGKARRQVDRREPQGRHLRRHQGRLQASEHDDGQAARRQPRVARAGVLLGRRRIHRVERVYAAEEEPAEISRSRR